jgi:hypothetical protein
MKEQIKEVVERVKAETPTHFIRMRNFGLGIAGIGLVFKLALVVFPGTTIIGLASLAPELISVGLAIAGVSQTAKK